MTAIEVFAPAKINLTLHVTGLRDDGYHLLDSLVVFARDVGDRITVQDAPGLSLDVNGPRKDGVPTDDGNLVLRAARLLRDARNIGRGAHLTVEKHLPSGGGIGGGSSDAAATLAALARLWRVDPLSPDEAVGLGADLPVCMAAPKPVRMRGIGDVIDPVPALPALFLVMVNPGHHVSTPRVFALLDELYGVGRPESEPMPPQWDFEDFHVWLLGQCNDLTKCAVEDVPEIGEVLDALRGQPGCMDADMSGSGSTCWGLFSSAAEASTAADALSGSRPGWWVRATEVTS